MDYRTYQDQTAKIRGRYRSKLSALIDGHKEKLTALKEEHDAQIKDLDALYKKEQGVRRG